MSLINTQIKPFKAHAYHNGNFVTVNSDALKGKWSVFVFYPADFTFVCPTELGDLADLYADFKKLGVEIYAVSTDTHFTHKAWHDTSDDDQEDQVSDDRRPDADALAQLRCLIEEEGLALRGTFVINPEGEIKLVEIHDNGIGRDARANCCARSRPRNTSPRTRAKSAPRSGPRAPRRSPRRST